MANKFEAQIEYQGINIKLHFFQHEKPGIVSWRVDSECNIFSFNIRRSEINVYKYEIFNPEKLPDTTPEFYQEIEEKITEIMTNHLEK